MRGKRFVYLISALLTCTALSACSDRAPQTISELRVFPDTSFSGTWDSWDTGQVVLQWTVSHTSGAESYKLQFVPASQWVSSNTRWEDADTQWTFTYDPTATAAKIGLARPYGFVTGSGNARELKLGRPAKWTGGGKAGPLLVMATHEPGQQVTFNLALTSVAGEPLNGPEISTVWQRPDFSSKPEPAKFSLVWTDTKGTDYEVTPLVEISDVAMRSFGRMPTSVRVISYLHGVKKVVSKSYFDLKNEARYNVWLNRDDIGNVWAERGDAPYRFEVSLSNSYGSTNSELIVQPRRPIKTQAQLDAEYTAQEDKAEAQLRAARISGCTSALRITEASAQRFDCGYLNVKVIQSDLNTGECNFLGQWRDRNSGTRTGLFSYCDAYKAGSFVEGRSYSLYVSVLGQETYTSVIGAELTVLKFGVLDSR